MILNERKYKTMKTIKNTLSYRNGIIRNSVSDRYYALVDLFINPFEFVMFVVDLVDNH